MRNKNVGYLIIGIALVIGIIILIFNSSMSDVLDATCDHGGSCTMYSTLTTQTYISLAVAALILIIGLFLIFSKEEKQIIIKKIKQPVDSKKRVINYKILDKEEKIVVKSLESAQGTLFQSDIVDKTGFDKVKITRILDRLEGKQLIERKRRGMTNVVILK